MDSYWESIKHTLPDDDTRQFTAEMILRKHLDTSRPAAFLDLGCGTGNFVDTVRAMSANVEYHGLDIEVSPESNARVRSDAVFKHYDGVDIPYGAERFDIVFSNQVFEHVRYPERLMCDVGRVLRRGGKFLGSVSQLEPYHSLSLWNFTMYGFNTLVESAGLKVIEFRPGIDAYSLIARSFRNRDKKYRRFFQEEGLLHRRIEREGRKNNVSGRKILHRKLTFSGHFCFVAEK